MQFTAGIKCDVEGGVKRLPSICSVLPGASVCLIIIYYLRFLRFHSLLHFPSCSLSPSRAIVCPALCLSMYIDCCRLWL